MPITWQNVNAPSNEGVLRGFAAAGDSFNGAFDKLGGILKGVEAAQQFQVENIDDAKVLAFKEAMGKARSPEEVASLQGQWDTMRSGLTNKGRTAVLGAEDARTAALQQQITTRNAFNDSQALNANQTNISAFKAAMAQGNADAAYAGIAPYQDKIPGFGDMAIQAAAASQHAQKSADDLLTSGVKRSTDTSGAAATTANAAANTLQAQTGVTNAATNSRQLDATLLERAAAIRATTAEKLGAANKNTIGSTEGFSAVMDRVSKSVDKDLMPKVTQYVAEALSQNPEFRNLPVDVVEGIVLKHANSIGSVYNPLKWGSASDIQKDLTTALKDPVVQKQMDGSSAARQNLTTQLNQQTLITDEAQRRVFPELQTRLDAAMAARQASAPAPTGVTAPVAAPAPVAPATAAQAILAPSRLATPLTAQESSARIQEVISQRAAQETATTAQAKTTAEKLIADGDRAAARQFQASDAFNQVDKESQLSIFKLVNGQSTAKKVK